MRHCAHKRNEALCLEALCDLMPHNVWHCVTSVLVPHNALCDLIPSLQHTKPYEALFMGHRVAHMNLYEALCYESLCDHVCRLWVTQCLIGIRSHRASWESDHTVSYVLQCAALCCSVLYCLAVCCILLQCAALCCSVLRCVAVCCNVL